MSLLFRFVLISSLFLGCAVKELTVNYRQDKIYRLENMLLLLSPKVDRAEAYDLAKSSVNYSYRLAKEYRAIAFPWLQNSLVNIGLKKRGLCHEWASDLWHYLKKREYRSFSFHAVSANIGYLNEHNALCVSAKGDGIVRSILLDAWRNSGDLYFSWIDRDKKYRWSERRGLYYLSPKR